MDNEKSSIIRICDKTVNGFAISILIVSLISFPICVFMYCKKYSNVFSLVEILWLFPMLALFALIFYFSGFLAKKDEKLLIAAMVTIGIMFSIVLLFSYKTEPISDYEAIWDAANSMAKDAFVDGINPKAYMYYYNWQLGIAAFESILIRVFGSNFIVLQIISIISLQLTNYLIYRLCKSKLGFAVACNAYVLSTLFLPWILSVSQFSNHHIALLLIMLVLWLLDLNKWYSWLLSGVCVAVLNVLRPVGIILILVALCVSIYNTISSKKPLNILYCLLFLVSFLGLRYIFDYLFIAMNYTDIPLSSSRIPFFKFQKGLYGYNTLLKDLGDNNYDYELYNSEMKKQLLDNVFHNTKGTISYVAKKMIQYLGLFDYQFEMTFNHDVDYYTKYPVKAFYSMSWFEYIGVLVLSLFGIKRFIKAFKPVNVYTVFFIGNTLVYIFIEAFSSYRYESYFVLIIMAAVGISVVQERLSNQNPIRKSDSSKRNGG